MADPAALREIEKAKQALDRAIAAENRSRDRFESALVVAAEGGASQREIASSAGLSQPYVSQVLKRRRRRFAPRGPVGALLASRREQVIDALEQNGIRDPAVFGSVARGEDRPDSDVDLLVSIPDNMGLLKLARVEVAVGDVLGAPVDLVPRRLLTPFARASAERDEVPL